VKTRKPMLYKQLLSLEVTLWGSIWLYAMIDGEFDVFMAFFDKLGATITTFRFH
jgi:hypothetical protein